MGGGLSKADDQPPAGMMKRSSSAAFGRLRIDSPAASAVGGTPGSAAMSLRRRRQLREMDHDAEHKIQPPAVSSLAAAGAAATSAVATSSSTKNRSAASEQTPLIGGASASEQNRQLEDTTAAGTQDDLSKAAAAAAASPPVQVWIVPALCCAMAYALYNIFIKKGSAHIHPILGGVILQLVAAVLGCVLLTFVMWREGADILSGDDVVDDEWVVSSDVPLWEGARAILATCDFQGVQWAIMAGLSVGTAEIVSFFVSSLGVQAMQSIPVIIGGSVLFGTVLGALALGEELSLRGWCGVFLISIGISLVGMDSEGEA
eukprot:Nitzschia sp. Nitz4//scaffold284_size24204//16206//17156//NITZ4_008418-RA/size24204-processed-gene-0.10-mRNA-1//-1//CDS//3329545694//9066//frame0